jgi:hypothetical protein
MELGHVLKSGVHPVFPERVRISGELPLRSFGTYGARPYARESQEEALIAGELVDDWWLFPLKRTVIGIVRTASASGLDLAKFNHQAQGLIHSLRVAENAVDIRVEQHHICARAIAPGVLAAHASFQQLTQIVMRPKFVRGLTARFPHIPFAQSSSTSWR